MAAQQGPYTISGSVVSTTTGQPLDRADVSLLISGTEQGQTLAEATTNADGHFAFTHLAAAKYSLRADRQGYLAAAYDEHEGFSTSIVTGEGLISDGLIFRLAPYAVIGGTITEDSGDPVSHARVSLFRQDTRSGSGKIVRAGSAFTDDTGAYEFARLEPGNYFLSVVASPWYASPSHPHWDASGNIIPEATRSPLDVAYPTTFYADVADENDATPIPIKAGNHERVDFTIHAVPAIHLSFKIPASPGQQSHMPQVQREIFGTTDVTAATLYYGGDVVNNSMLIGVPELAPGHYKVILPNNYEADVDASGDLDLDAAHMEPLSDVSGKVAMADGTPLPGRMSVSLQAIGGDSPSDARTDADGSFTIHEVSPGSYQLSVSAEGKQLHVARMTASGATVEGHTLKVGSQPVTLAVTLVEGSATLSGFAKNNGKPASGVMILLVPNHQKFNRELFRRDQSNSDGSFELRQVVPGRYTLVAIEDGWAIDWARPEAIAHYLAKGQAVTIPSGSRSGPLKAPIEIQPK
jgi:5-hydroxyisourate hydrolase-like protein (transthyretin family)